jgi:hypothetical protein
LKDKGERAGLFDLCSVSVGGSNIFCEGNLGVPRIEMPQLKGEARDGSRASELRKDPSDSSEKVSIEQPFTEMLRGSGVGVSDKMVDAEMLRPSQSQINGAQAGVILQKMLNGEFTGSSAIWTTSDGYILDGHHRYVAEVAKNLLEGGDGHVDIPVHEVNMEIGAALDATNAYADHMGLLSKSVAASAGPVAFGEFTEELHPRDNHGRFGSKDEAADPKANNDRLDRFMVKGTKAENGNGVFGPGDAANAKAAIAEARGADLTRMLDERPELRAEYERQMAYPGHVESLRLDYAKEQVGYDGSKVSGVSVEDAQRWLVAHGNEVPPTEVLWGRDTANRYVGTWAHSAADRNSMSLAMQMAAADELGLSSPSFDSYIEQIGEDPGSSHIAADLLSLRQDEGETMRAFARAEYDSTQRGLADAGFKQDDQIELYRGMQFIDADGNPGARAPAGFPRQLSDDPNDVPVRVDLNPLSSWTVDRATAHQPYFSGDKGYILTDHVAVSDIVSTARTGRGALGEGEIIVRNTPDREVIVHRNDSVFGAGSGLAAAAGPKRRKRKPVYIDDPRQGWDDWIKHAPVVAAGDFDEEKHPRDNHGRFGSKDEDALAPPKYAPGIERYQSVREAQQLLMLRPDGSRAGGDHALDDHVERKLAKQTAARDVAARMSSGPTDVARAAWGQGGDFPPGHVMLEGAAGRAAYDDLIAEGQAASNPSEQEKADWGDLAGSVQVTVPDVLDRLMSTPGMLARVDTSADVATQVAWADSSKFSDGELRSLRSDGYVDATDPSVGAAIKETAVSDMVSQWASTSNDHSDFSLSMQQTAGEMFGLKGTAGWDEHQPDPAYLASVQPVQRDFLQAQYDNTQEFFKAQGVDSLTLQRGLGWGQFDQIPDWARTQGPAEVPLRPLSGWSSDPNEALRFSSFRGGQYNGAVISAEVPAARILAFPRTGIGCLNEQEFVVLGGVETVQVDKAAGIPPSGGEQ